MNGPSFLELQAATKRVAAQLQNVSLISEEEAYLTAMAHTRVFGLLLASRCSSPSEFKEMLFGFFEVLLSEGLSMRSDLKKDSPQ